MRLRQSTASQEIPLGHFVDETDGKTAETGLTIANTDIKLWKNGATTLANKNSGGATHISGGIYYAVLDATDTDTVGPLVIFVHVAGALPVRVQLEVVTADVFDNSDISGFVRRGTAQAGAAGTITLDASASAVDDFYNGTVVQIVAGTGIGQARVVSNYVGSTKVASVAENWATTPDNTSVFVILPSGNAIPDVNVVTIAAGAITAAAIATGAIDADAIAADAVTEIQSGLATAAALTTVDDFLDTEVAAIKAKTDQLTFGTANRVDAQVFGVEANALTAAALAADAVTEIQSGLATAAALDTVDNLLDTEIAAITGFVDDLESRLSAALATALAAHSLGIGRGVVDAGSSTTTVVFKSVNGAAGSAVNDFYNGRHIIFTSGALTLQATSITDYVGATKTATVAALTGTPAEDVTFIIV
jgi:hypothetical protein